MINFFIDIRKPRERNLSNEILFSNCLAVFFPPSSLLFLSYPSMVGTSLGSLFSWLGDMDLHHWRRRSHDCVAVKCIENIESYGYFNPAKNKLAIWVGRFDKQAIAQPCAFPQSEVCAFGHEAWKEWSISRFLLCTIMLSDVYEAVVEDTGGHTPNPMMTSSSTCKMKGDHQNIYYLQLLIFTMPVHPFVKGNV